MKKLLLIPILFLFSCGESVTNRPNDLSQKTGEVVFDGNSFYAIKIKVDSIEYIVVKSGNGIAIVKHK